MGKGYERVASGQGWSYLGGGRGVGWGVKRMKMQYLYTEGGGWEGRGIQAL